jgi:hypothetical protein
MISDYEGEANVKARNAYEVALKECHLDPNHVDAFDESVRKHKLGGEWTELTAVQSMFCPDDGPAFLWWKDTGDIVVRVECCQIRDSLVTDLRTPSYSPMCTAPTRWSVITLGSHAGTVEGTLPELLIRDSFKLFANYFNQRPLEFIPADELDEFMAKVARIKIPKPDPENWIVMHRRSPKKTYLGFEIIRNTDPLPRQAGWQLYDTLIDLRIPLLAQLLERFADKGLFGTLPETFDKGPLSCMRVCAGVMPSLVTNEGLDGFFSDDDNFVWIPDVAPNFH